MIKRTMFFLAAVLTSGIVGIAEAGCAGVDLTTGSVHSNGGGWVQDSAQVANTVYVGPDSRVCRDARVYGNAALRKGSHVGGNAVVYGNATLINAAVGCYNGVHIYGNARVIGAAICGGRIYDDTKVTYIRMDGGAVYGNAKVARGAQIYGGEIFGSAVVRGGTRILKNGKVNCGRWIGVTVTDDQTNKCGKNGSLGEVLSNPVSEENTESN